MPDYKPAASCAANFYHCASLLLASGKCDEAVFLFRCALDMSPDVAEYHHDHGVALTRMGHSAEAVTAFRRSLELKPDWPMATSNLALALAQKGDTAEAVATLQKCLALEAVTAPDAVKIVQVLTSMLCHVGKPAAAIGTLEEAIKRWPDNPDLHHSLGLALGEMGLNQELVLSYSDESHEKPETQEYRRNFKAAIREYERSLELKNDAPETHNNLGLLLQKSGQLAEAISHYQQAIRYMPSPHAYSNLGAALTSLNKHDEAMEQFAKAFQLDPDYVKAHHNKAQTLIKTGDYVGALACFDRALTLQPEFADSRFQRGLLRMLVGDYPGGLVDYEARWQKPGAKMLDPGKPLWDGTIRPGESILLWKEQGFGDMIQCARYATLLAERGVKVLLYVPENLVTLFRTLRGVAQVESCLTRLPEFTCHAPLMSVPKLWGMRCLDEAPGISPYLWANDIAPRASIREGADLVVGIVWRGRPQHPCDRIRSVAAEVFRPFSKAARLVSFTKEGTADDLAASGAHDIGARDWTDFAATATALKSVDLLISVDTSTAHLAGALGIPAWILLPFAPDCRWGLGRTDSPWYPTVRLFRQSRPAQWEGVFFQVAKELLKLRARLNPADAAIR